MMIDTRPSAKRHRAKTGHQMALISAVASSCAECDWTPGMELAENETLRDIVARLMYGWHARWLPTEKAWGLDRVWERGGQRLQREPMTEAEKKLIEEIEGSNG